MNISVKIVALPQTLLDYEKLKKKSFDIEWGMVTLTKPVLINYVSQIQYFRICWQSHYKASLPIKDTDPQPIFFFPSTPYMLSPK